MIKHIRTQQDKSLEGGRQRCAVTVNRFGVVVASSVLMHHVSCEDARARGRAEAVRQSWQLALLEIDCRRGIVEDEVTEVR